MNDKLIQVNFLLPNAIFFTIFNKESIMFESRFEIRCFRCRCDLKKNNISENFREIIGDALL